MHIFVETLKPKHMYNTISATVKAYEICFYFACDYGIETLEGLYSWEARDPSNRRLVKVDNHEQAKSIISNKKLLKTFAG